MGESVIMCGGYTNDAEGQAARQRAVDYGPYFPNADPRAVAFFTGFTGTPGPPRGPDAPPVQRGAPAQVSSKSKRSNKKKKTSTGLSVGNAKKLANSGKRKARPEGKSLQI